MSDAYGDTVAGTGALASSTETSNSYNTAFGTQALFSSDTGTYNTAVGYQALYANMVDGVSGNGTQNVAVGAGALVADGSGSYDTAVGTGALGAALGGVGLTAVGSNALGNDASGIENTAVGYQANAYNSMGSYNTSLGYNALLGQGGQNSAQSTAVGDRALQNSYGSGNIAIGYRAGYNLTNESGDIYVGSTGATGDYSVIRIGTQGPQLQTYIAGISGTAVSDPGSAQAVVVDDTGNLGAVDLSSLVGATGASGATGPVGHTGASGATGPSGPSGAQGIAGTTGDIGPTGPTGAVGTTGPGLAEDVFGDTAGGDGALGQFTGSINCANTAFGYHALYSDLSYDFENTAIGAYALVSFNSNGHGQNIALGASALNNLLTGDLNIAIGSAAGEEYTDAETGNIVISNLGTTGDSNTIRIGTEGTQARAFIAGISGVTVSSGAEVFVDSLGQLGTVTSSQRFKTDIRDMGSASEAILALRPVTFRYRPDVDPKGTPQYGLVAEEVEKVSPDLVVRDANDKAYTVRYSAVNAMLLNEFRKQHDRVEEQAKTIAEQAVHAQELQKEIEALKARQDDFASLKAVLDSQAARLEALEKQSSGK